MSLTIQRVAQVVETITDRATAAQVIAELEKPMPSPYTNGQVVVDTSSGRLFRWRDGMEPDGVRALNQGEIG